MKGNLYEHKHRACYKVIQKSKHKQKVNKYGVTFGSTNEGEEKTKIIHNLKERKYRYKNRYSHPA